MSCVSVQPQQQDQQCPINPTSAIVSAQLCSHGLPGSSVLVVMHLPSWLSAKTAARLSLCHHWLLVVSMPTVWNPTRIFCDETIRDSACSTTLHSHCMVPPLTLTQLVGRWCVGPGAAAVVAGCRMRHAVYQIMLDAA